MRACFPVILPAGLAPANQVEELPARKISANSVAAKQLIPKSFRHYRDGHIPNLPPGASLVWFPFFFSLHCGGVTANKYEEGMWERAK